MGRKVKMMIALVIVMVLLYYQQSEMVYGAYVNEPIECFRTTFPKEDGNNGWYMTKPEVTITHISKAGITRYRFTDSAGRVKEGVLREHNEEARIKQEEFREGKNSLSVWMEDEDGNRLEDYVFERAFRIDTEAPSVQLQTPMGTDVWYQKEVFVSVSAQDGTEGSQIARMMCYQGKQLAGIGNQGKSGFIIRTASVGGNTVPVTVKVWDQAGNCVEQVFGLLIDAAPPKTSVQGIEDHTITSQPVTVEYRAKEENILETVSASVSREDPEGNINATTVKEWQKTDEGAFCQQTLEKDGLYRVEVKARDQSGYTSSCKAQIIIDRTNPVIGYIDQLKGQYMQTFCLENPVEEWIQDYTSYTYSITLDGKPYHIGERVMREGGHVLEVEAVDAAGNKSVTRTEFVIDHTSPEVCFQGAEDGETYEEEVKIQISLKNTEDIIDEICINGERQELAVGKHSYQYVLQEYKKYELQVKASDQAGNQTTSRICFQVVEREGVFQKLAKTFSGGTTGNEKDEQEWMVREKDDESNMLMKIVAITAGVLIVIVVFGIRGHLQKKRCEMNDCRK